MSDTAKRRRGRPRAQRDEPTGDTLPKTDALPPKEPKEPKARAAASSSTTARGPGRPSARDRLEQSLAEQLGAIGLMVVMFNPKDGHAIVARAPQCAASLARLADQNPRVRRLLESGMTQSAWFGVIMAFGGLGLELAANHGQAPAFLAGTSTPAPADDAGVFGNLAHLFDKSKAAHPSTNGRAVAE